MAIYRLNINFMTNPLLAAQALDMLFTHMAALGVSLTALKVDTRAVTTGTFDLTTNIDIRADQLAHLSLTKTG